MARGPGRAGWQLEGLVLTRLPNPPDPRSPAAPTLRGLSWAAEFFSFSIFRFAFLKSLCMCLPSHAPDWSPHPATLAAPRTPGCSACFPCSNQPGRPSGCFPLHPRPALAAGLDPAVPAGSSLPRQESGVVSGMLRGYRTGPSGQGWQAWRGWEAALRKQLFFFTSALPVVTASLPLA